MPPTLENISRSPLVIFGAEDVILGFKALGFRVAAVKDTGELKTVLPAAVAAGALICLVEESLYQAARTEIGRYKSLPYPIFIPFAKGAQTDMLDGLLREIRLKATGVV